eukprot:RCo010486
MKFSVKWGKEVVEVDSLGSGSTVGELKALLQQRTGIPVALQKLLLKTQLKEDSRSLEDVGVKEGSKLMLMGSTVQQVLAVSQADSGQAPTSTGGASTSSTSSSNPPNPPLSRGNSGRHSSLPSVPSKLPTSTPLAPAPSH